MARHTSFGNRTLGSNLSNSNVSRQHVRSTVAALITAWEHAADGFSYFYRHLRRTALYGHLQAPSASRIVITSGTEHLTMKYMTEMEVHCGLLQGTLSRNWHEVTTGIPPLRTTSRTGISAKTLPSQRATAWTNLPDWTISPIWHSSVIQVYFLQ